MVWKTTDGFHVPQQSYPHFVTLALKNLRESNFRRCIGHRRNIFNDENFPIYLCVPLTASFQPPHYSSKPHSQTRLVFILLFVFTIVYGSGRAAKNGKVWEQLSHE